MAQNIKTSDDALKTYANMGSDRFKKVVQSLHPDERVRHLSTLAYLYCSKNWIRDGVKFSAFLKQNEILHHYHFFLRTLLAYVCRNRMMEEMKLILDLLPAHELTSEPEQLLEMCASVGELRTTLGVSVKFKLTLTRAQIETLVGISIRKLTSETLTYISELKGGKKRIAVSSAITATAEPAVIRAVIEHLPRDERDQVLERKVDTWISALSTEVDSHDIDGALEMIKLLTSEEQRPRLERLLKIARRSSNVGSTGILNMLFPGEAPKPAPAPKTEKGTGPTRA